MENSHPTLGGFMKIKGRPELLCPAGSPAALRAAIEGGADAIYMGGVAFNARINAKNFTSDELREGISLAHAYGVKVYITANTMIYDRESDDMLRAAEDAYLCGADALIVADLGAASRIRRRIPIALHASTQCAGHNVSAARLFADAGFERMVCAREMSREDLRTFVELSPIEAEVFVHGALCVCHSGQCLFSSLVGGRSGNRGECAQPCRLPFSVGRGTGYPLSLKDLSLAAHVPELIDMGIASFKIEGRMKSPEYVRDVARIWRTLIDEGRGASEGELSELASIFSRGGLTDGYYTKTIGKGMLGVRSEGDKQSSRALEPFTDITRKIPLSLCAELRADTPSKLTLTGGARTVTVFGDVPMLAKTAPLTKDSAAKNLLKFGNTPYRINDIKIELDEGLMLPVSSLNALRRRATEAYGNTGAERSADDLMTETRTSPKLGRIPCRSAVFYLPDRIPDEAYDYFDIIYTPLHSHTGTNGVMLPSVIFDSERAEALKLLERAKQNGAEHVLLGNAGHLSLAREAGLVPHGDIRLNIAGRDTAAYWERCGLSSMVLSPELSLAQMRDIGSNSSAVVYGRIPLMVTEKCVGREIGSCKTCERGETELCDRRGVRFPVLREWEHRSLIFNSVPIYMADRQEQLRRAGLCAWHFIFTVENKEHVASIIRAYMSGASPMGDVRRIK